jgi:hypothetical protein
MLTIITGMRPKICEKLAKFGWKTVLARRKAVPDQNASMAVPCNAREITGSATDMDVPSRATINVRTASEAKARRNRGVGLNGVGAAEETSSSGGGLLSVEDEEDDGMTATLLSWRERPVSLIMAGDACSRSGVVEGTIVPVMLLEGRGWQSSKGEGQETGKCAQ